MILLKMLEYFANNVEIFIHMRVGELNLNVGDVEMDFNYEDI